MTIWIGKNNGITILEIKRPTHDELLFYLFAAKGGYFTIGSPETNDDRIYYIERIDLYHKENFISIVVRDPN